MNSLFIVVVATAGFMIACKTTPTVPSPPLISSDATPPLLKLGTAGLGNDILLNQDSTAPEQRRAKRSDEILFVATAEDPETGIKSVTLDITISVICGETGTNEKFLETQYAPANTGSLPVELLKSHVFTVAPKLTGCRESPSSVTLSIVASTENGMGKKVRIHPARISSE